MYLQIVSSLNRLTKVAKKINCIVQPFDQHITVVSDISASSPVKETPPLPPTTAGGSVGPQDSAEPGKDSAMNAVKDAPKPDPDAWIQVEKRHKQPSGKAKVRTRASPHI